MASCDTTDPCLNFSPADQLLFWWQQSVLMEDSALQWDTWTAYYFPLEISGPRLVSELKQDRQFTYRGIGSLSFSFVTLQLVWEEFENVWSSNLNIGILTACHPRNHSVSLLGTCGQTIQCVVFSLPCSMFFSFYLSLLREIWSKLGKAQQDLFCPHEKFLRNPLRTEIGKQEVSFSDSILENIFLL